jgi:hypothetical protein
MFMLRKSAVVALALLFGGVALATPRSSIDVGDASLKLRSGMTEDQVFAAIGRPVSADEQTCGGGTANGAWHCRILKYGRTCASLEIYEGYDDNAKAWVAGTWQSQIC